MIIRNYFNLKFKVLFFSLSVLAGGCGGRDSEGDASGDISGEELNLGDGEADRWLWRCTSEDDVMCRGGVFYYCTREGEFLVGNQRDCESEGLMCIETPPLGCVVCRPEDRKCEGQDVYVCNEKGSEWVYEKKCNPGRGEVCISGYCRNSCEDAAKWKSNLGCEYYTVDLDNAMIMMGLDASSQQYAVVVSNPTDVEAYVTVERNNAEYGQELDIEVVDERIISPMDLDVILLDRREVDGTSPFGLDDGTGSALTSNAYRITSTAPVVVYQFNPLDNVNVFSNDASILIPTTACGTEYVVVGWPQTIADTSFPETDMNDDLRAFITIVGTDYETQVHLKFPENRYLHILGDGDLIPQMEGGDEFDVTLGPFDVLNLETDGFLADFSGTEITSSKPVVVFSGSEASDVPTFETLSERLCCADHLEQQIFPVDRNGRNYIASLTPRRRGAVHLAGGDISSSEEEEREYFKIVGLYDETLVRTTLEHPDDEFRIDRGQSVTIEAIGDFMITSDKPISVGQFVASQQVTGIPNDLPGGDPAFILVPPVEQWRESYIFLTPSLYAFDFIIISHPVGAEITLDGRALPPTCRRVTVEGAEDYAVTRCQLSFPEIVEGRAPPDNVLQGEQNDGVHELISDVPIGVIVYGFDNFVSYGYPGGTDLKTIE